MKKITALLLAALLLLGAVPALADTIDGKTARSIPLQDVGVNAVEEGISPTTGLALAELDVPDDALGLAVTGTYMPMVVQIDNQDGGVNARAPWGLAYADIIYETPLHREGATRLTAVFSDVLPTSVGPIRSARVAHVWIAREWGGGFVHFGRQEYNGSNAEQEMKNVGILRYLNRFDGTDGAKPWNKYFNARANLASPHNQNANVAGLRTLMGLNASGETVEVIPTEHALRFTDEQPTGGDSGVAIGVEWSRQESDSYAYSSTLVYQDGQYYRYLGGVKSDLSTDGLTLHVDKDLGTPITYANVIIQYTDVTWNGNDAPICQMVGSGNADYFIGGVHLQGCWEHEILEDRTIFYGPDGSEIALQRGKTLIIVADREQEIVYR